MAIEETGTLHMSIKKDMVIECRRDECIGRTHVVVSQLSQLHPVVDARDLVNVSMWGDGFVDAMSIAISRFAERLKSPGCRQ